MATKNSFVSTFLSRYFRFSIFLLYLTSSYSYSQESMLQLNKIMAGNEFIGQQPSDYTWGPNNDCIYFRWNHDNELIAPYYKYSLKNEELTKLDLSGTPSPLNGFQKHINGNHAYYKMGQSIFKTIKNSSIEIYSSTENFQLRTVIKDQLILKKDDNLFAFNLEEGSYKQLTNFVSGSPPSEDDSKSYLEKQQEELFETVRRKKAKQEARKEFNNSLYPDRIHPFYKNEQSIGNMALSEDLKILAFTKSKYPSNTSTEYMAYLTTDGQAKAKTARTKVGAQNPSHELYIWHLEEDTVVQINFSALSDLDRTPEYYSEYPEREEENYEKEIIYHIHGFNENANKCLIEIKSYDNKDRWIGYVDTKTNAFKEIEHQHDEAWIGGPGILGWNMAPGNIGWMNNEEFYFQSEETGYSHLYLFNVTNDKRKMLTSGNYEIHSAELSSDKSKFYISANKNHPGNREFYHLNIEDKELIPILTQDGNHEVLVSPNEKWLLVNYSYKNKPWDLYLVKNEKDANLKRITKSTKPEFEAYEWRDPEIITFNANDGQPVNARIYQPAQEKKNGAAIFFVHGAGYLQNAHNWWSGYYREYMFNNMLCDMGFTVMDVDYRASKGYGRDFRTGIYRYMGGKDLSDYVDARTHIIQNYGIDSNRIGIYGGSYGGFISIMALLTEPGKFKCGAAIRSLTDWAHYNHPYTSNILNTPEEDPIAFERSSPIYFANNLEDQLLMLHGMVDDNVQYQDVVRLSQRFIEEGKTTWDLIGYPIEPHGFKETASWIDEYGRILRLFQEELLIKK